MSRRRLSLVLLFVGDVGDPRQIASFISKLLCFGNRFHGSIVLSTPCRVIAAGQIQIVAEPQQSLACSQQIRRVILWFFRAAPRSLLSSIPSSLQEPAVFLSRTRDYSCREFPGDSTKSPLPGWDLAQNP